MNDTGITFSWLGAYISCRVTRLLGGEVIEKTLAASLKRRCLGKVWCKKTKIVSKDAEGQFALAKDIPDKHKFKLTNFDLRKDFKRK